MHDVMTAVARALLLFQVNSLYYLLGGMPNGTSCLETSFSRYTEKLMALERYSIDDETLIAHVHRPNPGLIVMKPLLSILNGDASYLCTPYV